MAAAPLFAPRGPAIAFRFPPAAGGARELEGVLAPLAAAGVAADDSMGVSAAGVALTWAMGASAGDVADFDDGCADGAAV